MPVIRLLVRQTAARIIIIMAAMVAIELGLFFLKLRSHPTDFMAVTTEIGLKYLWPGFLLLTLLALVWHQKRNSEERYTIERLRISEKAVFWWQSAVCFMNLLLVYLLQVILLWIMYTLYMKQTDQSAVTVYAEFYWDDTLHGIIPFMHTWGWIHNLIFLICGAVSCSCAITLGRHHVFRIISMIIVTNSIITGNGHNWLLDLLLITVVFIDVARTHIHMHDGTRGLES